MPTTKRVRVADEDDWNIRSRAFGRLSVDRAWRNNDIDLGSNQFLSHGVRYVLEGSIRRAGNRLRLTGQLLEAATGVQLWADRYDGALEDVFELQDEIRAQVLGALAPNLVEIEMARATVKPAANLDAYDLTLRAIAILRTSTAEGTTETIGLCKRASELDPDYALPYAVAGMGYAMRKAHNWMEDRDAEIAEASLAARRAILIGADNPAVLAWAGHVLSMVVGDLETGGPTCERAVVLSPNFAPALAYSSFAKIWVGEPQVAIERLSRAFRLSPLDPSLPWWRAILAHAHFHSEDYNAAVSSALESLIHIEMADALRVLVASCGWMGAVEKARRAMRRLQAVDFVLRLSTLRQTLGPYREAGFRRYDEGLRLAGLPE